MTAHHRAMRLQNQSILITGSTTGIGAAMARRFVAEGAHVILHGRDIARGEALLEELGAERPRSSLATSLTNIIPSTSPPPQWSALGKSTPW